MTTAEKPDFAKVREMIIELTCKVYKLPPEEVHPGSNFWRELSSDSLNFVELIIEIEEAMHITVDDSVAFNSDITVDQLSEKICQLIK